MADSHFNFSSKRRFTLLKMSQLKKIREEKNLTQEELAEASGISVRTIQRIEAGTDPKGHTLKLLARTLEVEKHAFKEKTKKDAEGKLTLLKFINLSSLPMTVFPPANILLPLLIMWGKGEFTPIAKQVVSLQIIWTILAFIIFMLSAFMKNWFSLSNKFNLAVMVVLVLSNVYIILRNTAALDKNGKLRFQLNFSII